MDEVEDEVLDVVLVVLLVLLVVVEVEVVEEVEVELEVEDEEVLVQVKSLFPNTKSLILAVFYDYNSRASTL